MFSISTPRISFCTTQAMSAYLRLVFLRLRHNKKFNYRYCAWEVEIPLSVSQCLSLPCSPPGYTGHGILALTSSLRRQCIISFIDKETAAVNSKRILELELKFVWLQALYTDLTRYKICRAFCKRGVPCSKLVKNFKMSTLWCRCCEFHSAGPWGSASRIPVKPALPIHLLCPTQLPNGETFSPASEVSPVCRAPLTTYWAPRLLEKSVGESDFRVPSLPNNSWF